MIAAWIAGTKVQQVRVFFLPVGHTHILIDHIFRVLGTFPHPTAGCQYKPLRKPLPCPATPGETNASRTGV